MLGKDNIAVSRRYICYARSESGGSSTLASTVALAHRNMVRVGWQPIDRRKRLGPGVKRGRESLGRGFETAAMSDAWDFLPELDLFVCPCDCPCDLFIDKFLVFSIDSGRCLQPPLDAGELRWSLAVRNINWACAIGQFTTLGCKDHSSFNKF